MELQDIIDSVDILEYISQYCDLEEKNGEWWSLSPLKEEQTPSFSVDAEKQVFYDFSSGQGGNVLSFIRAYHHCGLGEAIELLKQYAHIEGEVSIAEPLPCVKIMKKYRYKAKELKTSEAKPLPDDHMELYENAPEKLRAWEEEGISPASMEKFQVRYDRVSDRIVYPIRSIDGSIINVCGRTLDPQFKEKKIRKYTYFHSMGTLNTLYGLWENRAAIAEKNEVILFEGAKSVMLCDTWGIHNTAALLTSHLSPFQLVTLIQLGANVCFALDEEVDIEQDANIQKLKRYVRVYAVRDNDHLLESRMAPVDAGLDVWQVLYEKRVVMK